jgi:pimeloyl-ACP methyl ester carboxylesterase
VKTYQEEFKVLQDKDIPVLVIYGTRDEIVSLDELKVFVEGFKNGELKIYEDARHPAYLDYPDQFRNDVYQFYSKIVKS